MQRVWRTVTGFYHVCARGTGKQLIFEGDEDRWEFLELMRECCRKAGVTVIAWWPYGQSRASGACRLRGRDERGDAPAAFDVRAAVQ